ncbi:MAG: DUF2147 domain-containing protein [Pseudomonadota bacterium]|nr:DUF2147 domain-containing protein [Pseudomonadota bacterium]
MLPRIAAILCLLGSSALAAAADPLHDTVWRTFDDATGVAKAIVQLEVKHGVVTGKIIQRLEGTKITNCVKCTGALKNQPLVGLPIVYNLKAVGNNSYENGEILDPLNGKTYRLRVKLSPDEQNLEVRGFIGVSMLGRTQIWKRER